MENKTRKLTGIEKICIAGIIGGLSLFYIEGGLNAFSSKSQYEKTNLYLMGAMLLSTAGYVFTNHYNH